MITTKNRQPFDGDLNSIKGRAAFLVQALEGCPLEFTLETLAVFDRYNSPNTKSRSAKRWIRQFCGFESQDSNKAMDPIIEVTRDGQKIAGRGELNEVMKNMRDAA